MPVTETPEQCDKRGAEGSLYYNVGDDETPVWVKHVGIVGDLNVPETEDEDQLNTRDPDRKAKEFISGEVDVAVNGTQVTDPDYEGWVFLNSMRRGGVPRDVLVLTGSMDEVGSYGWRGYWWNKDRTTNMPETGGMTNNFNLRPAACTSIPVHEVKMGATEEFEEDYDPADFTPYEEPA